MTKEDWRYRTSYAEKVLAENYRSAVAQLKEANILVEQLEAEKKILQNINAELEARIESSGVESKDDEWSNAMEWARR